MEKKTKVITYGTFDLLHPGHIHILRRAKALGDYLIVGVSTEEFNEIKGKQSYYKYEDRKFMIEALKCVDEVIPEKSWDQKIENILLNEVDVFVMGSDWEGEFDYLSKFCEVVYLPRTENISTSQIKEVLNIENV
ncbi:glycerol-3-phosphate cytidylyltransferase [Bacillus wiedmannii]|uniref:glycerol-3-phosphate cytidylyltransferase n=1 Tax=Bacillus wiedmannii TaxID=1890302 RepID=UPI000BF11C8E|nr:glycerol-3-phosphate cytidylyltransferase [Bacillus wiedmannii]PEM85135.1 glycerol-3-phosphate cytidylyltransferase [Bacillus wiedmannii]PEO82749.1 glycerol-3-phosphate cytidylyltransferase [Bacillus wiedmannii]